MDEDILGVVDGFYNKRTEHDSEIKRRKDLLQRIVHKL
jgi:adenosine/AMP kinase